MSCWSCANRDKDVPQTSRTRMLKKNEWTAHDRQKATRELRSGCRIGIAGKQPEEDGFLLSCLFDTIRLLALYFIKLNV